MAERPSAASHPAVAGQSPAGLYIGRYRVLKSLGVGACGEVFACHDPVLDRLLALKILRARLPEEVRERYYTRFTIEVRTLGRLAHPNVIGVYDAGLDAERPYLGMELCCGPSLHRVLSVYPTLPLGQATWVLKQLTSALGYVHELGIVHRDIKPANLLFHYDVLKLTDFGVAHTDTSTLTMTGDLVGTPSYMSPEQIRGLRIDHRSDLYALGVMLFQMLAGRRPFLGDPAAMLYQVSHEAPPKFSSLAPGLLPELDDFFDRALATAADDRFQSADELFTALLQVIPESLLEPIPGMDQWFDVLGVPPPPPGQKSLSGEKRSARATSSDPFRERLMASVQQAGADIPLRHALGVPLDPPSLIPPSTDTALIAVDESEVGEGSGSGDLEANPRSMVAPAQPPSDLLFSSMVGGGALASRAGESSVQSRMMAGGLQREQLTGAGLEAAGTEVAGSAADAGAAAPEAVPGDGNSSPEAVQGNGDSSPQAVPGAGNASPGALPGEGKASPEAVQGDAKASPGAVPGDGKASPAAVPHKPGMTGATAQAAGNRRGGLMAAAAVVVALAAGGWWMMNRSAGDARESGGGLEPPLAAVQAANPANPSAPGASEAEGAIQAAAGDHPGAGSSGGVPPGAADAQLPAAPGDPGSGPGAGNPAAMTAGSSATAGGSSGQSGSSQISPQAPGSGVSPGGSPGVSPGVGPAVSPVGTAGAPARPLAGKPTASGSPGASSPAGAGAAPQATPAKAGAPSPAQPQAASQAEAPVSPPGVRLLTPAQATAGQPLGLEAEVERLQPGQQVVARWRMSEGAWSALSARELAPGRFKAELVPTAGRLQYRFEVVDSSGVARAEAARELEVRAPAAPEAGAAAPSEAKPAAAHRAADSRGPDSKAVDGRAADGKSPDGKSPESRAEEKRRKEKSEIAPPSAF